MSVSLLTLCWACPCSLLTAHILLSLLLLLLLLLLLGATKATCQAMAGMVGAVSIFALVMGSLCSSTNSTPWGGIQSCCHHGGGNYSNTQEITVQPGTHLLLSRDGAHTCEVPCPRTPHHIAAAETHAQDLLIQVAGRSHGISALLHVYCVGYSDTRTLRVVIARGLSSPVTFFFFYVPFQRH